MGLEKLPQGGDVCERGVEKIAVTGKRAGRRDNVQVRMPVQNSSGLVPSELYLNGLIPCTLLAITLPLLSMMKEYPI